MTDCTEYEVLLSTRLDGELPPDEDARLTAHLAACPSCQTLAAELEALHAELSALPPLPPTSLAESVMEQVRAEAKPIPFPAKSGTAKRRRRYGALAAMLALVILGGSIFSVSPLSPFHLGGSAPDMETAAVTEEAPPTEEATDSPAEAVPAETEDMAENAPVEEYADTSNAGEAGGGASYSGGSHLYSYTAEPAPPLATEPAAADSAEAPDEGEKTVMEAPTAENAVEPAPAATQSNQANNAITPVPLSKAKAQSRLQAELNNRGGDWTITDSGQNADGEAWLFTAEDSATGLTHHFSVTVETGQVTELPPPTD